MAEWNSTCKRDETVVFQQGNHGNLHLGGWLCACPLICSTVPGLVRIRCPWHRMVPLRKSWKHVGTMSFGVLVTHRGACCMYPDLMHSSGSDEEVVATQHVAVPGPEGEEDEGEEDVEEAAAD